jgi:4-amino-4-deoxychorismate lyase
VTLIDGRPGESIPVTDRGLNYGDGLFETVRLHEGEAPLLARHLQRLRAGCQRLGLPYPGDATLEADVRALLSDGPENGVLRLVLTRGDGGRGYAPPPGAHPRRILSVHPLPDQPGEGLRVGVCRTRIGRSPALAGLKHLGRLEQVIAAGEIVRQGWDEGLMLDESDLVIEGSRHNLFYLRDGQLLTPPLPAAGVAGVMRALLLEVMPQAGLSGGEATLRYHELHEIESMFLCNAVVGIRPVKALADRPLAPVAVLPQLRAALVEAGARWVA